MEITLLSNIQLNNPAERNEFLDTVASFYQRKNEEAAVALALARTLVWLGLCGFVWTKDLDCGERLAVGG